MNHKKRCVACMKNVDEIKTVAVLGQPCRVCDACANGLAGFYRLLAEAGSLWMSELLALVPTLMRGDENAAKRAVELLVQAAMDNDRVPDDVKRMAGALHRSDDSMMTDSPAGALGFLAGGMLPQTGVHEVVERCDAGTRQGVEDAIARMQAALDSVEDSEEGVE